MNVTVIVQDPPAATSLPQVFVWEKTPEPVITMLLMLSAQLPTLVSVVAFHPFVEKNRLDGLNSTDVPTPVRLTFCGLCGALSVIEQPHFGFGKTVVGAKKARCPVVGCRR